MKSGVHAVSADAAAALERGDVLVVNERVFETASTERGLFSPSILAGGKNVSFDPTTRRIGGSSVSGAEARALEGMLARFSDTAQALVEQWLPHYGTRLRRARTSFRPVEIAGRASSWRKDDTRLHVDSFPATPVGAQRILRVFCNVNPEGRPRSWRIGEDFEALSRQFAPRLRIVTKTRRAPYDSLMLQLHDHMKSDHAYQAGAPQTAVDFPPGTTWLAFTDQVSHAAMAGQYQLEQTFLLPVDAMIDEQRSPLRILERLKGRPLIA
jgi:hypothetical protein